MLKLPPYTFNPNRKRLTELAVLACIIFMGLAIRVDDIYKWRQDPQKIFAQGEPLLTTGDGYFYLRLARDIGENNYKKIDKLRAFPEYRGRPEIPPLLSVITSFLHQFTSIPLNWLAVLLPVPLSVLLAVPLYAAGKHFGGAAMALSSVALGVTSCSYLLRTSLGRFDTDCMNVVFTMGISLCFLKFSTIQSWNRNIYLGFGFLLYLLFLTWWDQAPKVVCVISLFPFAVGVFWFFRSKKVDRRVLIVSACVGLGLVFLKIDMVTGFLDSLKNMFAYISKDTQALFPQIGVAILEQGRIPLPAFVQVSTNSILVFILAIFGLILLAKERPRELCFFLIPIVLGCFALFFAKRFLIFAAPVLALGFGFIIQKIWDKTRTQRFLVLIAPVLVAFMIWKNFLYSYATGVQFSPFPTETIGALEKAGDLIPTKALIWSSCDNGYITAYWADRATMCDGQFHGGERAVYNALPFATDNYRLAANFLHFFAVRGQKGIREVYDTLENNRGEGLRLLKGVLSAGPEEGERIIENSKLILSEKGKSPAEWMSFFYPEYVEPVYLFIDWRMILESPWLYWYGTWDPDIKDGIKPLPGNYFFNAIQQGEMIIDSKKGMKADVVEGTVYLANNSVVPLASSWVQLAEGKDAMPFVSKYPGEKVLVIDAARYQTAEETRSEKVRRNGYYHFEFHEESNSAFLIDQRVSQAVYFQLFWHNGTGGEQYFRPVLMNTPHYQLWEVSGDTR